VDLKSSLSEKYGIPHYLAYLLIAGAIASVILSCVFGGIYYSVHVKVE
jgi:hypothetical protein